MALARSSGRLGRGDELLGDDMNHILTVQRDWLDFHPPRYPDQPNVIRLIISYCELEHHDGVGYRACRFLSAGKTTDEWVYPYIKIGGTHLMDCLQEWHRQIVALFQRVQSK